MRIVPGTGDWRINGRTLDDYFPDKLHQQIANEPFAELQLEGRFDVIAASTVADRRSGRRPAPRRGPLAQPDRRQANRPALKKAGLLTRDARVVERKKAGLKKARKASQFSKR